MKLKKLINNTSSVTKVEVRNADNWVVFKGTAMECFEHQRKMLGRKIARVYCRTEYAEAMMVIELEDVR